MTHIHQIELLYYMYPTHEDDYIRVAALAIDGTLLGMKEYPSTEFTMRKIMRFLSNNYFNQTDAKWIYKNDKIGYFLRVFTAPDPYINMEYDAYIPGS